MSKKHSIITAIFLLFGSFNLLALGIIYYQVEDEAVNFRYSDQVEYDTIREGIQLIEKLPIQFNITNEYFSSFDNLEETTREKILMAYVLKNNWNTYECGNNNTAICVDKETLSDPNLLEIFHTKTKFTSSNIKIYLDNYGINNALSGKSMKQYKLIPSSDGRNYRKYTRFSHYKEKEDVLIFYLYEGYYNGSCEEGKTLDLYDFMTGKSVYTNTCNDKKSFQEEPLEEYKNLQLYKYELKRDKNGKLYLKGYNPVNK